jgi:serine/threonine protein kinase
VAAVATPIPVRWTAPEVLNGESPTTASDRWSFGVLLWEVYTLGALPYAAVPSHQVAELVGTGSRPLRPKGCPDAAYRLMRECWASTAVGDLCGLVQRVC